MHKSMDPIFSFYLTKNGASGSKITFGGYNAEKYGKAGKDIKWLAIDAEIDNYWSLSMDQTVSFGQDKNMTAKIASKNAILDTGLSYALVPSRDVHVLS